MDKVPQFMSDRDIHKDNAGKFIVQHLSSGTPVGVLCMPFFSAHSEDATIFDTLEAADAAASLTNDKLAGTVFTCRAAQLVNELNGPRIYRAV